MGPKDKHKPTRDMFQQPLEEIINLDHPLVGLSKLIDWSRFEQAWTGFFPSKTGRPATSTRLVAGLLYLQHAFAMSDQELVWAWVENPYWQYFCGEQYFQHNPPIDPSSLTRWRKRIGAGGVELLLQETIHTAVRGEVVREKSFDKVIVDSTVMEKAIAYPTDSRLFERGRQHLVKLATVLGITLRQNYNRRGPRLAVQAGRYAHAKQFRRMRSTIKFQRTILGRLIRDIERKMPDLEETTRARAEQVLSRVRRLHTQKPKDKNKLYSLHAPEVECIGKGKSRTPYEFGVKVSVATTHKEGLVIGMKSLPGNPYDGHSLPDAIDQIRRLTDRMPEMAFVDRGYRGVDVENVKIYRSGQRRGVTPSLHKAIKRRSAIEPAIGHMKSEGRLSRNWLSGADGDAIHAVLCGAGHNVRMIIRAIRLCSDRNIYWLAALVSEILDKLAGTQRENQRWTVCVSG